MAWRSVHPPAPAAIKQIKQAPAPSPPTGARSRHFTVWIARQLGSAREAAGEGCWQNYLLGDGHKNSRGWEALAAATPAAVSGCPIASMVSRSRALLVRLHADVLLYRLAPVGPAPTGTGWCRPAPGWCLRQLAPPGARAAGCPRREGTAWGWCQAASTGHSLAGASWHWQA